MIIKERYMYNDNFVRVYVARSKVKLTVDTFRLHVVKEAVKNEPLIGSP